jgi:tetratricopeptide (TPR) repeat protein
MYAARRFTIWFTILSLMCGAAYAKPLAANKPAPKPSAAELMAQEVGKRLVAVTKPLKNTTWPPKIVIDSSSDECSEINAYATPPIDVKGLKQPICKVVIYKGMMDKIIKGDEDRLAFIMGHELAHISLGHTVDTRVDDKSDFIMSAFTREQEIQADVKGAQIMMAAGYSFQKGKQAIIEMQNQGLEYSSFEGLGYDHPSWNDRLVFLDKDQANLWKSMSAFSNGTFFLRIEDYSAAEACFSAVKDEFPDCYEAYANLGYAQLMQYCDKLRPVDMKGFDVGQIVCGAFYERPKSLQAHVRGIDEDMWWKAVGSLREALKMKPDLAMAKANLGVAYLLRPAGRDLAQATKYLTEAAEAAEKDKTLDLLSKAVILANAGVADLASGELTTCSERLTKAEEYGRQFAGSSTTQDTSAEIARAILYNHALVLEKSTDASDAEQAVEILQNYLESGNPSSEWWTLAYSDYSSFCKSHGAKPRTVAYFKKEAVPGFRPITSVTFAPNKKVTLSMSEDELTKALGSGTVVPLVDGSNMARLYYPAIGADFLVMDQVTAIILNDAALSPSVQITSTGLGGKTAVLKIGMSVDDLEKIVGTDILSGATIALDDPDTEYEYIPSLGLAYMVGDDDKITELVVVQSAE